MKRLKNLILSNQSIKINLKTFFLLNILFIFFGQALAAGNNYRITPVVKAVKKVAPAVVNISTEYEITRRSFPGFELNPFFESFFRDFFEDPGFIRRYKRNSLGSGVIIDGKRGFILTNDHVIAKTGKISVTLINNRTFDARIVGADKDSDLAILKIESNNNLPSVEMGNSDDLLIGETVIAIGNPFGFSNTVTTGVISATNRSVRTNDRIFRDFIQTDASINPGNSGGPLLNINGELIGINTAIYAKAQGIGFAIPINRAKVIVNDLIKYGEVHPAWIGLLVQRVDERLMKYLKLPYEYGVMVKRVFSGGPAEDSGIKKGDIILSLNGKKIYSVSDFFNILDGIPAGRTVEIESARGGRIVRAQVLISKFPLSYAADYAYEILGIRVANISSSFSGKKGVLITEVNSSSYLGEIGVRKGDVLRQINEIRINNSDDFKKAIAKYHRKRSLVLLVQRGENGYYITVEN